MKFYKILLSIILLTALASCAFYKQNSNELSLSQENVEISQPIIKNNVNEDDVLINIDKEYAAEILETNGITSSIIDLNNKYAEIWEQEMKTVYSNFFDLLNEENQILFAEAQKKWDSFQNDYIHFKICFLAQTQGKGSYLTVTESEFYLEKYRTRTLELKDLLDYIQ